MSNVFTLLPEEGLAMGEYGKKNRVPQNAGNVLTS
jgi:hypothetical protein